MAMEYEALEREVTGLKSRNESLEKEVSSLKLQDEVLRKALNGVACRVKNLETRNAAKDFASSNGGVKFDFMEELTKAMNKGKGGD